MIRKRLRPYQVEAVQAWRDRQADGLGLFHEQRVGKTLPALAIADEQKPDTLLVITTKKGISVWQKEIHESVRWDHAIEVRLIQFHAVQNKSGYAKLRRWLMKSDNSMVIIDEAHHIKRRSSRWSKRCRGLGKVATYRLALTGTPIAQGIQDAWAIFDFLDPEIFGPWQIVQKIPRRSGRPIIRVIGGFQFEYLIMDAKWSSKVAGYQNEERFHEIYHQHSIRKTLAEVKREAGERPPRIIRSKHQADLSTRERRHYDELEAQLVTVVNRERIETPLVMTLTMKLQQICGGFIIDQHKNAHRVGTTKLRLLTSLLDRPTIVKPVVICRFLHEIRAIEVVLKARYGSVKIIQGGSEFDASQAITEGSVILQIQSGVAIDLAVFDTIIFYSWDYSHINHEQSRFRILSYNSSKVSYHYLVMRNSVDELMLEAVSQKKRFADIVCDHYWRQ